MRRNGVHLGYFNAANFGDALSPALVGKQVDAPVFHSELRNAHITAVGSLLSWLEEARNPLRPFIWGTGFIEHGKAWSGPAVRVRAVRGELSLERLGRHVEGPVALGDPGLLTPLFMPELKSLASRFQVSVIPHYVDAPGLAMVEARREFPGIHVIDVRAPLPDVLREIAQSEFVLSSSLHGLICSDALDIPNVWTPMSSLVVGGDYKFRDYYSVFGMEPVSVDLRAALADVEGTKQLWRIKPGLDGIQQRLIEAFPADELMVSLRG